MVEPNLENMTKKCLNRYENAFSVDKDGLISMMLDQFNTPLLCFREIIQNGIDENATYIDVVTQVDKSENRVFVSIEDDGQGMDKEKIERYLTLFDSTKENLLETIGEMGVGKIFAFALNPEYLVIETGNGQEGYKIIFREDMSGELLSIPPRKGTRATVVTKYDKEYDAESYEREVYSSIKENCCYVSVPIKVNGEKINADFDADTPHKIRFGDGNTRGIVALTGSMDYTFLKGGILLEKGYRLTLNEDNTSILDGLEVLVDSFEFNQPLSRNAVQKDLSFECVIHRVKTASTELLQDLIDKYPEIERKNNAETRKVRNYLHNIMVSQGIAFLPFQIKNLKLFQTADGKYISHEDIKNSMSKEGTIYYSPWEEFNANELTYFTDRGIPVLHEDHETISELFRKIYGCGIQPVGDGLVIEGLINRSKRYRCQTHEKNFLDSVFQLLWDVQRDPFKRNSSSRNNVSGSGNISSKRSSNGNSSFDWNQIKEFRFDRL